MAQVETSSTVCARIAFPHNMGVRLRTTIFSSAIIAVTVAIATLGTRPALAQNNGQNSGRPQTRDRTVPRFDYYVAKALLNDGKYNRALKAFGSTWRSAIKEINGRWLDSICHYTMLGECYYKLGRPADAIEQYDEALKIYLAYPNWMIRVKFENITLSRKAQHVQPIPWGKSKRNVKHGRFADSMLILQGNNDVEQKLRQGGVVQQPFYRRLRVDEVVRCTALALRRRRELLGPTCKFSPLTRRVVDSLSQRPATKNHWSQAWLNLQLGLAHAGADRYAQAVASLRKAQLALGEFDHPLTGVAMLELGRLMLENGKLDEAAVYFEEAGYAAYRYEDLTVLEEAMRFGYMVHQSAGRGGLYPPLVNALTWSKRRTLQDELTASLALLLVENYATIGQISQAKTGLTLVSRALGNGKSSLSLSPIGARYQWQLAAAHYQSGSIRAADSALTTALALKRAGSTLLYQIQLVDRLWLNTKALTSHQALLLYEKVLREPTTVDWLREPLDSLAVLTTPHPIPFENWFELSLRSKGHEKALQIAELAKRHRYYNSLKLGGRLLALRWLLEGPESVLDKQAGLQKQELLGKYPAYAKLSKRSRAIRDQLVQQKINGADADSVKLQQTLLAEVGQISNAQEIILHVMALRRGPTRLVFPPIRSVTKIQGQLPKGHALWIFFATRKEMHAFMLNQEAYDHWVIPNPEKLKFRIASVLQSFGNFNGNTEININQGNDKKRTKAIREMLGSLLAGSKVDLAEIPEELIIVPDGVLWYLPFEALEVGPKGSEIPLISRVRVRYAPTASLALPYLSLGRNLNRIGVTLGKLHPREDDGASARAFAEIKQKLPGVILLPEKLPASSPLVASQLDGLIVLDEIEPPLSGRYDWSPLGSNLKGAPESLGAWLRLPWGKPQVVIMPGFHTAAERSLKGKKLDISGNDMFLPLCAMMSTGTRTVLISRWRMGGKTSYDLVREFSQELPFTSAADAWQRSVQLAMQAEIESDREPRVKQVEEDSGKKSDHPLFWAGYLLIDSGMQPRGDIARQNE